MLGCLDSNLSGAIDDRRPIYNEWCRIGIRFSVANPPLPLDFLETQEFRDHEIRFSVVWFV